MKVAIVGYRNFKDYQVFEKRVNEIFNHNDISPFEIVSGGAEGVDTLAEIYANEYCIPITVFPANWNKYGRSAGPKRNKLIVDRADVVIAFLSKESKGTVNTINLARKANKKVFVIDV